MLLNFDQLKIGQKVPPDVSRGSQCCSLGFSQQHVALLREQQVSTNTTISTYQQVWRYPRASHPVITRWESGDVRLGYKYDLYPSSQAEPSSLYSYRLSSLHTHPPHSPPFMCTTTRWWRRHAWLEHALGVITRWWGRAGDPGGCMLHRKGGGSGTKTCWHVPNEAWGSPCGWHHPVNTFQWLHSCANWDQSFVFLHLFSLKGDSFGGWGRGQGFSWTSRSLQREMKVCVWRPFPCLPCSEPWACRQKSFGGAGWSRLQALTDQRTFSQLRLCHPHSRSLNPADVRALRAFFWFPAGWPNSAAASLGFTFHPNLWQRSAEVCKVRARQIQEDF